MNLLQETIPILIKRALSFEADRSGNLRSLMAAESQLLTFDTPRDNERWLRNKRAKEIAQAWYSITGDADKHTVTRCREMVADKKCWLETYRCEAFRRSNIHAHLSRPDDLVFCIFWKKVENFFDIRGGKQKAIVTPSNFCQFIHPNLGKQVALFKTIHGVSVQPSVFDGRLLGRLVHPR